MKFARNARIFRGHLDAAPFIGVFFVLILMVLLGSLTYTPGVRLNLPRALSDLPGVEGPTIAVEVDPNGQLYYENQAISREVLGAKLRAEVRKSEQPLTLVVRADKAVKYEQCVMLAELARSAGIKEAFLQTLPRAFDGAASPPKP
jgi:biopolymer transport protein ExbD